MGRDGLAGRQESLRVHGYDDGCDFKNRIDLGIKTGGFDVDNNGKIAAKASGHDRNFLILHTLRFNFHSTQTDKTIIVRAKDPTHTDVVSCAPKNPFSGLSAGALTRS